VRLAITATARSERRITVRGPGVGIEDSSASADPARGPWRSTAKSCQLPGTPRNSTLPRSSKPVPVTNSQNTAAFARSCAGALGEFADVLSFGPSVASRGAA
jgi:hypothetical protein